ncbi:MAG: hypothetical protein U0136_15530 [Bdellovibrionota bacterium]
MKLSPPTPNPEVEATFERLAEPYPVDYLPQIESFVSEALFRLQSYTDEYLGPNLKVARQLAERSRTLLKKYPSLDESQRALVVGAVRYFIIMMDNMDDTKPITGLDDDVMVMNTVLDRLGMADQRIDLP